MTKRLFILLALLFPGLALAQNSNYQTILLGPTGRPLAGATITVCPNGSTGIPCSTTSNIFNADGSAAANPITSDGLGNWGFWAPAGTYVYTVTGPGVTATGPTTIILPCIVGGSCAGGTEFPVSTLPSGATAPLTTASNANFSYYMQMLASTPVTVSVVGIPTNGNVLRLDLQQPAAGGVTVTFPANFFFPATWSLSTTASAHNRMAWVYDNNGNWQPFVDTGGSSGGGFYQTIQDGSGSKTQRPIIKFPAFMTCVDNAGNTSTDCTPNVATSAGAGHQGGVLADAGAVIRHLPWCDIGAYSTDCQATSTTLTSPITTPSYLQWGAGIGSLVDMAFGGPNPDYDIRAWGGYVGPNYSTGTTGTISGSSPTLTLASALDFAKGHGILVLGAGAAPTIPTPDVSTSSAAPVGATGSTTYNYCIVDEDYAGGRTACGGPVTVTTAAATLGLQSFTIASCSRTSGLTTCTTTATHHIISGAQIEIQHSTTADPTFEGAFTTSSASGTTVTFQQLGIPDASGTVTSGTLRVAAQVLLKWKANTSSYSILKHRVYRCPTTCALPANAANYAYVGTAIGFDTSFLDRGYSVSLAGVDNGDVSATAPTAATKQWLATTISSISGNIATLATNATTGVSGASVFHDNAPNILSLCQNTPSNNQGALIYIPSPTNSSYVFPIASTLNLGLCTTQVELDFGSQVYLKSPIIPKNLSKIKGVASGNTTQTTNFYGLTVFGNVTGNAYPMFYMLPGTSSNSLLDSLIIHCSQTQQVCVYSDLDTTGGGVTSIRYADVHTTAGSYSTSYVQKGGFGYYWDRGGWGTISQDFSSPPAALFTVNCGNNQSGQILPGILYTEHTYAFGGVVVDSCGQTLQGLGTGANMRFTDMLFEGSYGPAFRLTGGTGASFGLDFFTPTYADFLGGSAAPLIDMGFNTSGVNVIHPFCGSGNQPVFGTIAGVNYQGINVDSGFGGCSYLGLSNYILHDRNNSIDDYSNAYIDLQKTGRIYAEMAAPAVPQSAVVSSGGSVSVATHNYAFSAVDFAGNETTLGLSTPATTTSGNQTVTITAPTSFPTGAIGLATYRDGTRLTCFPPDVTVPGATVVDAGGGCGNSQNLVGKAGTSSLSSLGVSTQVFTLPPIADPTFTANAGIFWLSKTSLWPTAKIFNNTPYKVLMSNGVQTIGQTACFLDTTTGAMGPCNSSAGNVSNAVLWSIGNYTAPGSTNTIGGIQPVTAPNSVPYVFTDTAIGGTGQQAAWALLGLGQRTVSGASDTILNTDRTSRVTYSNAGAVAVTVPQPAGFFQNNFAFSTVVTGTGGVVTFTPTSSTVNGNATLVQLQGQVCRWSTDNTNWSADCYDPPATAIAGINLTRAAQSLSWSVITPINAVSTAGYTVLTGDQHKLVSLSNASAQTATLLGTAPVAGWCTEFENTGAGTWTIGRNGLTIDGAAANLTLLTNQGVKLCSDGSNYFTQRGIGGGSSLSGLTTGFMMKAASATTATNSLCDEAITTANTLTCTDTAGLVIPKVKTTGAANQPLVAPSFGLGATTVNLLAKMSGATTAQVNTLATSDTAIPAYIVNAVGATTADLVKVGVGICTFDSAPTANNYVIASISSGGQCHDSGIAQGSPNLLSAPVWVVGVVESSTVVSGSNYRVRVIPFMVTAQSLTKITTGTAYTNATTTFSDVKGSTGDTLNFAVAASKNYSVSCTILWQGSASTTGPKFQFTGPASPTNVAASLFSPVTATTFITSSATGFSTSMPNTGTITTATNFIATVTLGLINGANAGTVTLQAAANGAGTLTIQDGSACAINAR